MLVVIPSSQLLLAVLAVSVLACHKQLAAFCPTEIRFRISDSVAWHALRTGLSSGDRNLVFFFQGRAAILEGFTSLYIKYIYCYLKAFNSKDRETSTAFVMVNVTASPLLYCVHGEEGLRWCYCFVLASTHFLLPWWHGYKLCSVSYTHLTLPTIYSV